MPEDAVNTIAGKADFLRQVVVRDHIVNGNGIPDIIMVKDTEDGDVVLLLVTAFAYIENVVCATCTTNASFLIYSPGPCASRYDEVARCLYQGYARHLHLPLLCKRTRCIGSEGRIRECESRNLVIVLT
jgi:hypothetical protein